MSYKEEAKGELEPWTMFQIHNFIDHAKSDTQTAHYIFKPSEY